MTPCIYRIDKIFQRYFYQFWKDRWICRIVDYNHMIVILQNGKKCHFVVHAYFGMDNALFDFWFSDYHEGDLEMSDCIHIFLIGPSGSGKNALAEELESRGYERVLPYATRTGDSDDYIFMTESEFEDAATNGDLAYVKSHKSKDGIWRSGFSWKDLHRGVDSVAIIDPDSYLQIYQYIEHPFGIYVDIPDDARIARLMIRGEDPSELQQTIEQESFDFSIMDESYQHVCKMRIGKDIRPDIEVDRIEGHLNSFRSEIFSQQKHAL